MPHILQSEITLTQLPSWFRTRLSAHRGYGSPQNSIRALRAALEAGFSMVEFDVLLDRGHWWLRHSLDDDSTETLADALALFRGSHVLPKVDFKLRVDQFTSETVSAIYHELARFPGKKLVNLAHRGQQVVDGAHPEHFFGARNYMHVERIMYDLHSKKDVSIMLNLDLQRYKQHAGVSDEEMLHHIRAIQPFVYSLSPELTMTDIVEASYAVANTCSIRHIHGWLHREKGHTITMEQATNFYNDTLAHHLEPMFDIDIRHQLHI